MSTRQKILVFSLIAVFCSGLFLIPAGAEESLEKKLDIYLEALSLVKNNFVKKEVKNSELVYGSIRGLLASLDDPYTRFIDPKGYKEMAIRLSGEYSGIGIYIGIKDKILTVISPIEGTPGFKAGIKSRDKIIAIDGKPTKDMALEKAVSLIRGRRGTTVTLTIVRGETAKKDFNIKREKIVIKSSKYKMLTKEVGYIRLNTFEKRGSPREMKKAIYAIKNKKAKGLILDVRGNGGGLLDAAVDIGSMFIKSGAIVQIVDREGMREVKYSSGNVIWDKPIVLLINEASASASEILAGALRDNKVATLVGEKSFGKASVQSVRKLQDGSAILLTIAKYLTPAGEDINKDGITPDVVVTMSTAEVEAVFLDHQEDQDRQLERALKIINGKI
ncbi:S41 family peptidase [Candidatus Margulisiibacteriota bacterium]